MADEEQYQPSDEKPKKRRRRRKRRSLAKRIADLFPQKGDNIFEVLRKMTFLASSVVFVVCLVLIGKYFWENHENAKVTMETQEIHDRVPEPPHEEKKKQAVEERYEMLESAKSLLAENKDVVGYISIPNEPRVAYPVLQRRNPLDGNMFYLDKNIHLEYARAGSIFMDYRNYFDDMLENTDENGNPDGTYRRAADNSDNLIIYGHNMHDYSMFGSLKYYTNDESYYDAHPIVELESNYMKYQYKIFAMIIVDVEDQTETQFEYWNAIDFENEQEFYDYVNEIKRRTIRLTDVDVKYGDHLLTLSTCNSTFNDGRLVVFARLLRDKEDLMEGCTSVPNPNVKWSNSYYRWHKNVYDPNAEFIPYG